MQTKLPGVLPLLSSSRDSRLGAVAHRFSLLAGIVALAVCCAVPALSAQALNRITQKVDVSRAQTLADHHPLWANTANSIGQVPADLPLNQLTLVLARSPEKEQAFEQFLAEQQTPGSPQFHHWLTPAEVGDRFGLSDQDIAAITGWLESQGLQVTFVAPSRIFIGFSGTAANVGRAFQTEMQYYNVHGVQKLSVSSEPSVPAALLPAIKGVRGLYTIDERPNHRVSGVHSASPELNGSKGSHYVAPADFNKIYNVPTAYTGAGVTVGIVSWARTNFADFNNFKEKTGVTFANPTEVIPTAYGGIDPGPAYTAPSTASRPNMDGQQEATLDVLRVGSVAQAANILLVVSSSAGTDDGIGADAQYLVHTSPVPAQIMSISFGGCELLNGPGNTNYWNTLFQAAAAEGISVFVSSGDSGASGCEPAFTTPQASPPAISPNYICSSSYATCVGGTEFADFANPSAYWSSTNGTGFLSVLSYIPEGAWNEPVDDSTTPSTPQIAGTGGGVSSVIPTPSWQTGTGVPSARTGRYTPDVSFTASGHDGYFACMAAIGDSSANAGCVGSSFSFIIFSGTSASAPGMAGVAAMLDQKLGGAQGNLNPQLYPLAASAPSAFHDTTVASSGVTSCSVNTSSLCNNSMPLASGSSAQPGYLVGTGYDEATGLGSLDVTAFLTNYPTGATKITPTITWATPAAINYGTALSATQLNATATASSVAVPGTFVYTPAAGTVLTAGTKVLSVTFTPTDTSTYNTATGTVNITVNKVTPTITWANPAAITYGTALGATQLNATASVAGTFVYNPAAATVLTAGSHSLGVTFTPTDTTDYNNATGSVNITVNKATPTITWATPASVNQGTALSATQLNATANTPGTFVYNPPAGTVMSTIGNTTLNTTFTPTDAADYNTATASVTLSVTIVKSNPLIAWATPAAINYGTALSATQLNATATFSSVAVPGTFVYSPAAGAVLTAGTQVLSVTFTPTDTATYNTATGTVNLTVNKDTPTIAWATPTPINYGTQLSATQLNATASYNSVSIPGVFVYSPAAGTTPAAGSQTLSVTFTPTDATDYNTATGSVTLIVGKVTPTITWANPAAITYGTALGATQLNATASVPGTFTYTPLAATVLTAGPHTLSVVFLPTDVTDYNTATGSVTITVNKATPVITWATPASVLAGTALSATQLNATSATPGTFVYTPPSGTVTTAGTMTLNTTLTPTDTLNINPANASVTLTVTPYILAGPAVTIASPGATTGNTSTITVTPGTGFTGNVNMTAAITASPSGSQIPPTFTFTPNPVSITSTTPQTTTLTITTTAPTTASMVYPMHDRTPWYAGGGAALACLLFFCVPVRRRSWRNLLGMIALLFALAGGAVACGGGNSGGGGGGGGGAPGTTRGSYTITVTGTSGSSTVSNTIALTIN